MVVWYYWLLVWQGNFFRNLRLRLSVPCDIILPISKKWNQEDLHQGYKNGEDQNYYSFIKFLHFFYSTPIQNCTSFVISLLHNFNSTLMMWKWDSILKELWFLLSIFLWLVVDTNLYLQFLEVTRQVFFFCVCGEK
jgi:hypothetical protein